MTSNNCSVWEWGIGCSVCAETSLPASSCIQGDKDKEKEKEKEKETEKETEQEENMEKEKPLG